MNRVEERTAVPRKERTCETSVRNEKGGAKNETARAVGAARDGWLD